MFLAMSLCLCETSEFSGFDGCGARVPLSLLASLTKAYFTVARDRSEAENQCFCKALTTVSKIVIFRDFCKGGYREKSAKIHENTGFRSFWNPF